MERKYTFDTFPEWAGEVMRELEEIRKTQAVILAREKTAKFEKLVSRDELCRFLGCCELTAIRLERKGKFRSVKVGSRNMYDLTKVMKALEGDNEL